MAAFTDDRVEKLIALSWKKSVRRHYGVL